MRTTARRSRGPGILSVRSQLDRVEVPAREGYFRCHVYSIGGPGISLGLAPRFTRKAHNVPFSETGGYTLYREGCSALCSDVKIIHLVGGKSDDAVMISNHNAS